MILLLLDKNSEKLRNNWSQNIKVVPVNFNEERKACHDTK